ncbi:hypothetical protein CLD20_15420 [Afifella sp. IM 167]|nr:hypothetical protein [Afifella sp. IM 167]
MANPCAPGASPCAPAASADAMGATTGDAANPFDVTQKGWVQAPYGDVMPNLVKNYLRAAPYIGTGGVVSPDAFGELKKLGFVTVVNLNTDEEGAPAEMKAAEGAGLKYVQVAVATEAPTDEQIDEIGALVTDPSNYPLLIHCESSNRVGAAWALYRAKNGVPPMIAIQEGRTVGLKPSREGAVRERLGLNPL